MISRPLLATVPYIWSEDEALDRSDIESFCKAWERFRATGDVPGLPTKGGHTPAIFTLRPLTRKQIVYAATLQGLAADAEIIAYSLIAVTNVTVAERPLVLEIIKTPLGDRLSEKCLDEFFDIGLFSEMAARAIEISRLDFRLGKAS